MADILNQIKRSLRFMRDSFDFFSSWLQSFGSRWGFTWEGSWRERTGQRRPNTTAQCIFLWGRNFLCVFLMVSIPLVFYPNLVWHYLPRRILAKLAVVLKMLYWWVWLSDLESYSAFSLSSVETSLALWSCSPGFKSHQLWYATCGKFYRCVRHSWQIFMFS